MKSKTKGWAGGIGSSFTSQRSLANISDDFGCLIGGGLRQYPLERPSPLAIHFTWYCWRRQIRGDSSLLNCSADAAAAAAAIAAQTNNNCVRAEDKNVSGRYKKKKNQKKCLAVIVFAHLTSQVISQTNNEIY